MTIDELSRKVAEIAEPEPNLATRDEIEEWLDGCRKADDEPKLSTDWWGLTYQVSGIGYVHDLHTHARQITEPEVAMRLLNELLATNRIVKIIQQGDGSYFFMLDDEADRDKEFEAAIAHAWLRMKSSTG